MGWHGGRARGDPEPLPVRKSFLDGRMFRPSDPVPRGGDWRQLSAGVAVNALLYFSVKMPIISDDTDAWHSDWGM